MEETDMTPMPTFEVDTERLTPTDHGTELAESTGGRKIMTMVLEFELGPKKTHNTRLKEAYRLAVTAAEQIVSSVLLGDNVKGVTSRMYYGYRHLEGDMISWGLNHSEAPRPLDAEEPATAPPALVAVADAG